ncbi:GPR1 FUN34 yaaH family protein [Micractinium conductrix]|uniref:GPR1 FUN34 yaaH family protein n=1 Tax=Micractinium conductrix TaxID=554055 RepID=A0A2P6V9J9_9CHLO|nr:GPR1 FUN34 yaaH family protein [Micractinium conductrix]|eukprot:PSC70767.1 GPR1 FUN34 yaaH family protein [Micractinium conductrix]
MGTNARDDAAAEAVALLERRLARCTLFAEKDPHIQTFPATSNPGAFGMYGLGLTLTLQMLPNTGVVDEAAKGYMYTMALFFGGVGQLVCGCLEFGRRNTFACVTWLCFSAYWLGVGLTGIPQPAGVFTPSPTGAAAPNAVWGFLAFLLWTATFGTNLVLNALLLMIAVLLWLEAACPSHPSLYRATGIFGIVCAALAFYNGTSML